MLDVAEAEALNALSGCRSSSRPTPRRSSTRVLLLTYGGPLGSLTKAGHTVRLLASGVGSAPAADCGERALGGAEVLDRAVDRIPQHAQRADVGVV